MLQTAAAIRHHCTNYAVIVCLWSKAMHMEAEKRRLCEAHAHVCCGGGGALIRSAWWSPYLLLQGMERQHPDQVVSINVPTLRRVHDRDEQQPACAHKATPLASSQTCAHRTPTTRTHRKIYPKS